MDTSVMAIGLSIGLIGILTLFAAGLFMPTYQAMVSGALAPERTRRAHLLARIALVCHLATIVVLTLAVTTADHLDRTPAVLSGVLIGIAIPAVILDIYIARQGIDMQAHHDWLTGTEPTSVEDRVPGSTLVEHDVFDH